MNFGESFIIAEVGINHNGDLNIAKQLIDGAKWAGADAVKFQKRDINKVYSKEELDKPRESPWGKTNRDQKLGLEFDESEYDEIDRYCKEKNIIWFASPWDVNSVEFIKKYDLQYNKIASALLTHIDLLKAIASQRKHTFISTGMSTIDEIGAAINIFKEYECSFELMHCNSTYPMKDIDANLRVIRTLRHMFDCRVGYSGHEVGLIPSVVAVAMKATSIERHITLDRAMYGSDQAASVEIGGFKKMVDYIRLAERCLGDGIKLVTADEEKIKAKLRRTKDF